MDIKAGLYVGQRMEQRLVMTQALQQAIRLLQLSRAELADTIATELAENPLLEEAPAEGSPQEAMASALTGGEGQVENLEAPAKPQERNEIDWQSYFADLARGPSEGVGSYRDSDEERPELTQTLTRSSTLSEVLEEQLGTTELTPLERDIAAEIIGNLDDDGYFRPSRIDVVGGPVAARAAMAESARQQGFEFEQAGERLTVFWLTDDELALWRLGGESHGCRVEVFYGNSTRALATLHETDESNVQRVLDVVRGLDPPGIAARDLRACLMIQALLRHPKEKRLHKLIDAQLPHMEARKREAIRRDLRCTPDELERLMGLLAALEPRPGRRYTGEAGRYITPDVYVLKLGDDYTVVLNEDGLPRLRVSKFYQQALAGGQDGAVKEYLQEKMRSATWMIRSIHQRQSTIQRVTDSIMRFQRSFLELGVEKLKPLVLRDVAEDVRLHESTVSRVTTNKYVHTPQGIFELKYFFNSCIHTQGSGDDMAAEAVKGWLRRLIEKEQAQSPLSDQELAEILTGSWDRGRMLARLNCTEGQADALLPAAPMNIARRTVAKYREAMGIESSNKRRKVF
jgi:RNA polymerase sigma-54 factor